MSAEPAEPEAQFPYPVIRGDAAIVPLDDLRRLKAIERHASPEAIAEAEAEEAEIACVLAEYRQWAADGRPGEASQDDMEREFASGPGQ
jgi:hypothetical protein